MCQFLSVERPRYFEHDVQISCGSGANEEDNDNKQCLEDITWKY